MRISFLLERRTLSEQDALFDVGRVDNHGIGEGQDGLLHVVPVHVRTGHIVQVLRMLYIVVGRRPLKVRNDDAQFPAPALIVVDIVPNLFEVGAAGDLGDLLEFSVDFPDRPVLGLETGAGRHIMAERIEVHIDVQLFGQHDAGLDGVFIVLFRDRTRRVDIEVNVRVVSGADGLALLVEVIRVSSIGLLECHVRGFERILRAVDHVHALHQTLDDVQDVPGCGRSPFELDIGGAYGASLGCQRLIGCDGTLCVLDSAHSCGQLLNLVRGHHVDLHLKRLLNDVPFVRNLLSRSMGMLFDVDHDECLRANQFAQVERQNAGERRVGLSAIGHEIADQRTGKGQRVVVLAVVVAQNEAFCQAIQIQLIEVSEHLVGLCGETACNGVNLLLKPVLEVFECDSIGEVYAQGLDTVAESQTDEEFFDVILAGKKSFGRRNDVADRCIDHGRGRERHIGLDGSLCLKQRQDVQWSVGVEIQQGLSEDLFAPGLGSRVLLNAAAVQDTLGNRVFINGSTIVRHRYSSTGNERLEQRFDDCVFDQFNGVKLVFDACRIERRQLHRLLICDLHALSPFWLVGEEHGHVVGQRRAGGHEGGHILLVELVTHGQRGHGVQVVANERRRVRRQRANQQAVVGLLIQSVCQAAGAVAVAHVGNQVVHVVHSGADAQLVVAVGLGDSHRIALVGDGGDALGDFVQQLNGEQRLAGVAEDDFLQDIALGAVHNLGLAEQRQQLLIGVLVQETGQSRDGSGRGNLLHALVITQNLVQRRLAVVIVVLLLGRGRDVDGLAENCFGMILQDLTNKGIQRGVEAEERAHIGGDVIQNETGDAGLVQRRDIALVVAGRDDLQIAGQLGGADSPERRNGQTLGRDVGRRSVQLVHEQNGRLPGMAFGVFDGIMNDLMGIKDLRVGRVAVLVRVRNQSGASEVSLVGQLVAGKDKAFGTHALGQSHHP